MINFEISQHSPVDLLSQANKNSESHFVEVVDKVAADRAVEVADRYVVADRVVEVVYVPEFDAVVG